jgi:hypothetical protein
MDAANAAAMSDPHCNPHFRRRWNEGERGALSPSTRSSTNVIGTLGLALQEAMDRRRSTESAQAVATNNGDPPR